MCDDLIVVGVDTGGTFTDFVVLRGERVETAKVLSTPDDPARAIREGLDRLGLGGAALDLVHGTTVGTNAVLEGRTARVLYVCNTGFADLLTLARQNREHLYRLDQPPVPPPVPRDDCLEVSVRRAKDGSVIDALAESDLAALRARVGNGDYAGVAVNLLFSFVEPADEDRLGEAVGDRLPVSLSSRVLPEIREYERGMATWLNAAVGPLLADYLGRLEAALAAGRLSIMQSDATTVDAGQASGRAVHLLLSGPAGGLAAAGFVGRAAGEDRLLTGPEAGITRDAISVDWLYKGREIKLIDTAGLRRKGRVHEAVEKFSALKTLESIRASHVVILVLDAHQGIAEQDQHVIGHVLDAGRALLIAVNKWDGLESDARREVRREHDRRLRFVEFAETHYISALHGTGVGKLMQAVRRAHGAATRSLSTPELSRILEDAVTAHAPPMVGGGRIKLRYAHQTGSNPPSILVHGSRTDRLPGSYKRYLENTFRKAFKLQGTPIKLDFRSGANPYAGKKRASKKTATRKQSRRKTTRSRK